MQNKEFLVQEIKDHIKGFVVLQQRWDGYQANPIKTSSMMTALGVIDLFYNYKNFDFNKIKAFPMSDGGIQFEFEFEDYKELEILGNEIVEVTYDEPNPKPNPKTKIIFNKNTTLNNDDIENSNIRIFDIEKSDEKKYLKEEFISKSCEGEYCRVCGKEATNKLGEEIPHDDPNPYRHNLTAYVCRKHFKMIVG